MTAEVEDTETVAGRRETDFDAAMSSACDNARAQAVAQVFPIVISVGTLGPTLLAMGVSFAVALTAPELWDEAIALSVIVSARGQNAVARWMMLGPGVPKTRWLLGFALLSVDWLAFGVFLRMTTQSVTGDLIFFACIMKVASAAFALGAWGCVFLAAERDRIPGIEFQGRGYGARHLLLGLTGFGLLLAGARVVFVSIPDFRDALLVVIFVLVAVEVFASSIATFLIDLAMRFVFLSRNSDRQFVGALLLGALALLALAAVSVAAGNRGGAYVAKLVLLPASFYVALSVGLEVVLRLLGVRAVSQFEPRDDAERAARRLHDAESQASDE